MIPPHVAAWLRSAIGSFWALELLRAVRADPARAWSEEELVREMRSSVVAVAGALARLRKAGVVAVTADGRCRYAPVTPEVAELADAVAEAYRVMPTSVLTIALSTTDDKLRSFADAFKLRKDT